MNRGTLVNGEPTSQTFASTSDSLEALADALGIRAAAGGQFEADGTPDLWDALVADSSTQADITTLTGNRDASVIQRLAAIVNALQITDAGTATGFEEDGTGGRLWESLVAVKGTFTTSSTTVPADTGRTEANDYWNGSVIIPISGAVVGQARIIADFANAGGVFTLDAELPFTAAPGLVNYIIIQSVKYPLVPAADSASNTTTAHVIGNKSDTNAGNSLLARQLIPGTDAVTNTNARDVLGSKADTAQYDSGTTSSLIRYLRATIDQLKELKRQDLYPVLSEFWASDNAGIDGNMWVTAVGSAGTVTRIVTDTDFLKVRLNTVDAVDASTARLRTVVLFRATPTNYTTSGTPKRLRIQWEAKFVGAANIDNATFFMGLSSNTTATRATTDIIGYGLSADAIQTVTDLGGVEGTNLPGGITLTNRNEYAIEITRIAGVNTVEFFINDTLVATHNTAANIPDVNAYWFAFTDNEAAAGGSNQVDIGAVTGKYYDADLGSFE